MFKKWKKKQKQLAGVIRLTNKKFGMTMMWYKNFINNLIFDFYMLFIIFFRLMLSKAVSNI